MKNLLLGIKAYDAFKLTTERYTRITLHYSWAWIEKDFSSHRVISMFV